MSLFYPEEVSNEFPRYIGSLSDALLSVRSQNTDIHTYLQGNLRFNVEIG